MAKPRWVGTEEESIHIAHVASVKIDTHLFFSDVLIKGWTVDAEDTEDSDKRREINDRIRRLRDKLKTSMNKSLNLEPAEVKV